MSMVNALVSETKPKIRRSYKFLRQALALDTSHQIHGGTKLMTMAESRKRANGDVDFIPEHRFEGQDLIPGIPNVIVAEAIWPILREGDHDSQIEIMSKMRVMSKFWCAFIDCTDLMDRHMMSKYNRVGPWRFKFAPGRFMVFSRLLE